MGKTNFNQTALNKEMQKGYRLDEENNIAQAVVTWMKVWEKIKRIMEKHNISSVEEMDKEFEGTQLISNWANDFEMTLTNAANKDPKFLKDKYKFCTEYVERAAEQAEHNILNMKSAIAQMHFKMQEPEKGEQLFEELTSKYPQWGWGWIFWSDMYGLFAEDADKDEARAMEILKQALEIQDLEDKDDVQDRLEIYE